MSKTTRLCLCVFVIGSILFSLWDVYFNTAPRDEISPVLDILALVIMSLFGVIIARQLSLRWIEGFHFKGFLLLFCVSFLIIGMVLHTLHRFATIIWKIIWNL